MTKYGIIKCLLSLALIAYLVFALGMTSRMAATDTFKGVTINVVDSVSRKFVTADDIDVELGNLSQKIQKISHDSLNTYLIEKSIMSKDNIETANCVVLNDGSLRIDVVPLIPLARVFDLNGDNYYINRAGKRMDASVRYRTDVPVMVGKFSETLKPTIVFPLLDYIADHADISDLTSAIEVKDNGDIILVPSVKGHVVNIGDTNDLKNKFDRLSVFYRKVMPVKGWDFYDTISVKWRGQVVAKQRHRKDSKNIVLEEEHIDLDDEGTMLTTAGQG